MIKTTADVESQIGRLLCIPTRLVRPCISVIVQGESIVAIVDIDAACCELPGAFRQFSLHFCAQTVLVPGISVIAIQVNVVDKAIILISARADAKANIFADGSGEHAAGTERTVVTRINLQAS